MTHASITVPALSDMLDYGLTRQVLHPQLNNHSLITPHTAVQFRALPAMHKNGLVLMYFYVLHCSRNLNSSDAPQRARLIEPQEFFVNQALQQKGNAERLGVVRFFQACCLLYFPWLHHLLLLATREC